MKLLVTGGAGFIGLNFVALAKSLGHDITVIDSLTYASNHKALPPGVKFHKVDIRHKMDWLYVKINPDVIVHFAAESHVDRSITGPEKFITTNVNGTLSILESLRGYVPEAKFIQVSTDEVYGSADDGVPFTESHQIKPSSPYSASKAAADLIVKSYHHTYKLNTMITRCSNNYGPYQFPEKLIPLFIKKLIAGEKVPVYGDGMQIRDWIHVSDHCRGIMAVVEKGVAGEVYNIGSSNPKTNLEIVTELLKALNRDESFIEFVTDRLGHDRKYLIDSSKIQTELGWEPKTNFEDGLRQTIEWYKEQWK